MLKVVCFKPNFLFNVYNSFKYFMDNYTFKNFLVLIYIFQKILSIVSSDLQCIYFFKTVCSWNALVVHWLGLCTSIAEGTGSVSGWGTKILHATWHGQGNKKQIAPILYYKRNVHFQHSDYIAEYLEFNHDLKLTINSSGLPENTQKLLYQIV